jgi:hypothetical protein
MHRRLPSWSATSRAGRLLLAVAGVLAVFAAGAISVAFRTPPTRLTHTVRAEAPSTDALDAAGCPIDARCVVGGTLPGHILDAIRRRFPASVPLWQSTTADADTGTLYQAQAAVTPGRGASLLVTARCLPGSTAQDPDALDTSAQQRSDLAGNQLALLTLRHQRVAGAPGCDLELVLAAPGDGGGYLAALDRLAHDPAAQVRS